MSGGAAGGVSHGRVQVVGNVPACVPGGGDAELADLQIGVDAAGRHVVLIKQALEMLLKEVFFRDASENLARALGIAGGVFDTARWPDAVIAQATCDVRHT